MSPHSERILVRGVNWLGDAVMTTPALQRLREARPRAHITLLTPAKLADLWRHHPSLDSVLTFVAGESVLSVANKLRRERFDLALVLPNSARSALEVWLAGIPHRVGGVGQWRRCLLTQPIPPRPDAVPMQKRSVAEIKQLIATSTVNKEPTSRSAQHRPAHHLHQYLNLVAALGGNPEPLPPLLNITGEEVVAVADRFALREESPARPLFGLNAGAEYGPAKRWPRERFVAAAIELQKRTNCRWLIFGGPAEVELGNQIASEIEHKASSTLTANLAGKTSLRELMALLKLCRVLLTNDSGPMHVAAALGTPVVVPFGSTSPELTGPGRSGDPRHRLLKSDAPCSPCFLRECPIDFRCMTSITVEHVVEATIDGAKMRR